MGYINVKLGAKYRKRRWAAKLDCNNSQARKDPECFFTMQVKIRTAFLLHALLFLKILTSTQHPIVMVLLYPQWSTILQQDNIDTENS